MCPRHRSNSCCNFFYTASEAPVFAFIGKDGGTYFKYAAFSMKQAGLATQAGMSQDLQTLP